MFPSYTKQKNKIFALSPIEGILPKTSTSSPADNKLKGTRNTKPL